MNHCHAHTPQTPRAAGGRRTSRPSLARASPCYHRGYIYGITSTADYVFYKATGQQ